jgi:hypothetical protein
MDMRCISVTWVVSAKMANRDAERGPWADIRFGETDQSRNAKKV